MTRLVLTALLLCLQPIHGLDQLSPFFAKSLTRNSSVELFDSALLHASGLRKRQLETCTYPQPWIACSPTTCCPADSNCRPDGCCPKTAETCGKDYCLTPDQSCCPGSVDSACDVGFVCTTGEGGLQTCCYAGQHVCANGNCFDENQECCGTAGGCSSGTQCMTSSGGTQTCCEAGMTACDNGNCCYSGTTCTANGKCRVQETEPAPEPTKTPTQSQSVAVSEQPTTPTQTSGGGGSGGGAGSAPRPTSTITFRYYPAKQVKNSAGKRIPLDNKAIMENMCEGIKAALGEIANEIQLTKSTTGRDGRRDAMCPEGWCADALKAYAEDNPGVDASDFVFPSDMSCDEFPFASSKQGGVVASGSRICVPGWQNSWQGGTMSRKMSKIAEDEDFMVILEGWDCESNSPTKKKREVSDDLTSDDLWSNFADTDQNAMIMSLGDLPAGSYSYNLTLASGTITSAFVTDYLGYTYYDSTSGFTASADPNIIDFTLDSPAAGVGLIAFTDDNDIAVSYRAQNTSSTSSSGSGSPTPTGKPSGGIRGWGELALTNYYILGGAVLVLAYF